MPMRRITWRTLRLLPRMADCEADSRWMVKLAIHPWTGGEGMNSCDFIPGAALRKTCLLCWRQVEDDLLVIASGELIGRANRVGILWCWPAGPVDGCVFKELDGVEHRDNRELLGHDLGQPLDCLDLCGRVGGRGVLLEQLIRLRIVPASPVCRARAGDVRAIEQRLQVVVGCWAKE